jgi:hypothetical protein
MRGGVMKNAVSSALVWIVLMAISFPAMGAKPVDENGMPFGNGFPSGKHFNLNIIAKKDNFNCPEPKYDPNTGEQRYGNVIFIPREQGNDPITILMESGKKGPKWAQNITELQVTDWCSESFSNDGGSLRLPANDKGYAVYARITGKPAKNNEPGEPNVSITPNLVYVEDEAGNDLILLGLVDRQGVAKFGSDGTTLYRTSTDSSKKGKGVQKATDITSLFEWTGEVCYLQEDSYLYCQDDKGNWICSPLDLCCVDTDGDGLYDHCDLLSLVGIWLDHGAYECPVADANENFYFPVTAECRSYVDEWVFNIGDFVGYLWDIDSSGAFVIKVRFYPL